VKELQAFMAKFHTHQTVTEEELTEIVKEYDESGDGMLNYTEFSKIF